MRFANLLAACAALPPAAAEAACGTMPPTLAVPEGHQLAFVLEAEGVQIYSCDASGGAFGWAFQAPEATLTEAKAAAGTHYAGPTWEATDGSKVVCGKVAAVSPDPASIPWLLLKAESNAGRGRMGDVTYVQRILTSGGAPPGGCDAGHAGVIARVPYRATYCFYRKVAAPL